MPHSGFLWECDCGHAEYGENPPEACKKCSAVSSFEKVPEELVAQKEEENILSQSSSEEDDGEELEDVL
tara:strand:- start:2815 stop:3021 length:207 start_codon:yes stop_codon:yes gene_type:complete